MQRILAVGVLALALTARADALSDSRAIAEAFVKAANIEDPNESVKQVLTLFADDAQHLGVFGHLEGKAAFQEVLPKIFAAPNRKNELVSHEGTQLSKDVIVSISHFLNSFTGPDGKTVTLPLRCVRTLKKQKDGRYLIAAEHTSVGVPPPPAPPSK